MMTEKKKSPQQRNTRLPLRVMREGQVCPDGVVIDINWGAFEIGTSVFIPAINLTRLNKQMQKVANNKQMQIKGFDRIESGKLGMRFWRIL